MCVGHFLYYGGLSFLILRSILYFGVYYICVLVIFRMVVFLFLYFGVYLYLLPLTSYSTRALSTVHFEPFM